MHIHFIGIAGSAIAPLAIMTKQLGHTVTGSEHNKVWEPAKSLLQNAQIPYTEQSYNFDNIRKADLIILGGSTLLKDPQNPEYLEAQKLKKPIHGFVYLVEQFITKQNSIVVAGTYGKTTTTSAITWILEVAKENPSFMIGGKPLNFESGVRASQSAYSCVEGDEFIVLPTIEEEPKFIHYNPTTAIITAAKWDHIDVYPTEEDYIKAYFKLIDILRKNNGNLIIAKNGQNNDKIIKYFDQPEKTYTYQIVKNKKQLNTDPHNISTIFHGYKNDFASFTVYLGQEELASFETTMIGQHNIENLTSAILTAYLHNIPLQDIQTAVRTFKGVSRRQESRGENSTGALILDDFAHSPVKAKATLEAIREKYPDKKIIAVFSPRISDSVDREVLKWYPKSFDSADMVIIPHIPIKKSTPKEKRLYGKDIINAIKETQPNAQYMPRDEQIIEYLRENTDENSVIVFMAGKSWDEVIGKV